MVATSVVATKYFLIKGLVYQVRTMQKEKMQPEKVFERFYLFVFREWGREGEREGKKP